MERPAFRFAPSPNGRLHLGHARSALLNAAMARETGGRLLLRHEDIDTARCTPDLARAAEDDLAFLGLVFDGPARRQSEHFAQYRAALERLLERELVYPAFLSRGEVRRRAEAHLAETGAPWPRDPDGALLYPQRERDLSVTERAARIAAGEPHAFRLDMGRALALVPALRWTETGGPGEMMQRRAVAADPAAWGDVVLARMDVPTSYHLSVVVDDALQGVTHVVRGLDLFHATSVHRLLQVLLGLPEPVYHHHSLILGADGRKLSKSEGATAIRELREAGRSAAEIRAMAGVPDAF